MTERTLIDCHVHLAALPEGHERLLYFAAHAQESALSVSAVEARAVT